MNERTHAHRKDFTRWLWAIAFYLAILYLALRFGAGHTDSTEPSWVSS